MTAGRTPAPALTPDQQAVVARFGIFAEEERVVRVARGIDRSLDSDDPNDWTPKALADALLAPDGAVTELIAEAVAEARRPFLALAKEFDERGVIGRVYADRIRAAAAPEEGR